MKRAALIFGLFLGGSIQLAAQQDGFRWLNERTDSDRLRQVVDAFSNELRPDREGETGGYLPHTVKYIHKVGTVGNAALVILGHKENESDPYPVYRAFNYNLSTHTKASLTTKNSPTTDSEWFPMWRFERVAHFERRNSADVVFRYYSCTECESVQLLTSFHYDADAKLWRTRTWSKEDGDSLMIGSDAQHGDDQDYFYDCLHVIRDLTGDGLDDAAVRCREHVSPFDSKPPTITKDETLLYTLKTGRLTRIVLSKSGKVPEAVQSALCDNHTKSELCRGAPAKIQ
jgi:hypothetical protein